MLRAHEIGRISTQTKIVIEDEVNIILLGNGSAKRWDTDEAKVMCAVNLGVKIGAGRY